MHFMTSFSLAGHPFITLNNLLKVLGLVATGGEANQVVDAGEVRVNGEVETRRRRKLYVGDRVAIGGEEVEIAN
jgi:ribosome-associated protein